MAWWMEPMHSATRQAAASLLRAHIVLNIWFDTFMSSFDEPQIWFDTQMVRVAMFWL
jgi:hypothetical protein